MTLNSNRIDEIVDFNPRRTISKGKKAPFIEMAALPIDSRDISAIDEKEFTGGGSKFQNGDTLFARITPCLENGKTAKVSGLRDGEFGFGSTEFIVMSAKEPEYDEEYVYYIARLPEFRIYAQSRMEGTSGRQRVAWQSLADFNFPFPERGIRKKVGKILKGFDDKIALNTQINQTLESMAQALFKSWFVDFDPVKAKIAVLESGGTAEAAELAAMSVISGKDSSALEEMQTANPEAYEQLRATAALFPSRLVESELGLIPEGWGVKSLDQIAKYQNGLALQKFRPEPDEVGIPVLKIAQLSKGIAEGEERATAKIKPECIVNNGDVVFSWSGSLMVDVWCGGTVALNQHLFKVTSESYPKWYYLSYTKHHLEEFQRIASAKAVTMGHIKREHLSQALCAVPTDKLFDIGNKSIGSIIEMQIVNRLENSDLTTTRDTLLPKLLSGEIDLSAFWEVGE